MKCLPLFGLFLLFFPFSSCNDKTEDPAPVEENGIAIQSIEMTSQADLSGREDWILHISYAPYDFRVERKQIQAKPSGEPAHFDKDFPEGYELSAEQGPIIYFVPPSGWPTQTKLAMPPLAQAQDQSTQEKLLAADDLFCRYAGPVAEQLTGIHLIHANALLDFEVIHFPEDASVKVESEGEIKPYQEGTHYQAIIPAGPGTNYGSVIIRSAGILHEISLLKYISDPLSSSSYIPQNTHFQFTIRYDQEEKSFLIENVRKTTWSAEE
ncbi:MAG: hypothetical protein LUG51_06060 [Tannerellaceae bacterium]|nr:hypothetical protein [Tannerellaceae bacterium]